MRTTRLARWLVAVSTGSAIVIGALAIGAYSTDYHAWRTVPVPYYVNPVNNDVPQTSAEAAIRQGADAWGLAGAAFSFSFAGLTSATSVGFDGRNVVLFRNSANGSTIAETLLTWDGAGSLIDTDIVFYDGGFTFFTGTSGCVGGFYIEDIATHEFGHALGLNHSTVPGSTMQATVPYCSKDPRTLDADDIAGVQALYPPLPPAPPATPGNLTATRSTANPTGAIVLQWTDRSNNEDAFLLERSTNGVQFTQVASLLPNTTSYTDQYLAPSTTYTYRLRASNTGGVSGYTNLAQASTAAPVRPRPASTDYDGDLRSDPTVFRPGAGAWFSLLSGTGSGRSVSWGVSGDLPEPGDYDGDGQTDQAVFRPSTSTWYVMRSSTGSGVAVQWGASGDIPVAADYDGDGVTDVAVFRPSTGTWFVIRSATGTAVAIQWGQAGDKPVPADFDGDGKADPTVFRPATGTWYELRSTTGSGVGLVWGLLNDFPLAADYDGDGKADPTVFRAATGTWFQFRSTTGGFAVAWGGPGDTPLVGDYDGDGKADPTVYRPSTSTWYELRSGTGTGYGVVWGAAGDLPQ